MNSNIIAALIGVIGALIGAWIGGIISKRASIEAVKSSNDNAIKIMQRQEFFVAASKFKATVIYELIGFYPTDQIWDEKEFPRFHQSIPKIKSAAAEFRYFVKRKTEFDAAVKEYHDYCQQRKYKNALSRTYFPNSPRPPNESGINPVEEFKNIVEHLLSFANEK
jgi:hypothetical protein